MKKTFNQFKNGVNAQFIQGTKKVKSFLKDETSANQYTDTGNLVLAGIVAFLLITFITLQFLDISFNDLGNMFIDGVNGNNDQSGLNQWSDTTNGFVEE